MADTLLGTGDCTSRLNTAFFGSRKTTTAIAMNAIREASPTKSQFRAVKRIGSFKGQSRLLTFCFAFARLFATVAHVPEVEAFCNPLQRHRRLAPPSGAIVTSLSPSRLSNGVSIRPQTSYAGSTLQDHPRRMLFRRLLLLHDAHHVNSRD
jgi:hypothetical protein